MQPRTEGRQRCVHFGLSTVPVSRVLMYQDHDGNVVHHFDIPGRHSRLTVTAEAVVECSPPVDVPDALDRAAWQRLDEAALSGTFREWLYPSTFARPTPLLQQFAAELRVSRDDDPLTALRRLVSAVHERFEYAPLSTRVDSPIDHALADRRGVCQDFAHIFIGLARQLGVPCRYVSGYLFQVRGIDNGPADGATHAWTEAWLPSVGWIGFDPTNAAMAGESHIRVAIGRDYADVPPTRGVFKGTSEVKSELSVSVAVGATEWVRPGEALRFVPWMSRDAVGPLTDAGADQQ